MKINVEINLNWIDDDQNIDDEIKYRIVNELTKKIEQEFLGQAGKKIADSANSLIKAKVEMLINGLMEKPIKIPMGWQKKDEEFDSIYDMVEEKITSLYQGKFQSSNSCTKDPLLANIEKYVENQVSTMTRNIEKKIDIFSKEAAKKAIESNKLIQTLTQVLEKPAPKPAA